MVLLQSLAIQSVHVPELVLKQCYSYVQTRCTSLHNCGRIKNVLRS